MEPKITNLRENNNILNFTLSGVNYSIANGLRRTILSDIDTVVIHTSDESISLNTSRLNNEIIRQRLGCIPVHIKDLTIPIENYVVEIDIKNESDKLMIVTTQDIKVQNLQTNTYLSKSDVEQLFPPNNITGDFIDILRLRPKLSDNHNGEMIKLACALKRSNANENGMYNVVSTCSYGATVDNELADKKLKDYLKSFKDKKSSDLTLLEKDWNNLDRQRYTIENSFDFIIETVGVFENMEILELGLKKLIHRLQQCITIQYETKQIESTIKNCYEVKLDDISHTIGNIINFCMYDMYYEKNKVLNYNGFLKKHPHDTFSTLKLGFNETSSIETVRMTVKQSLLAGIEIYKNILTFVKKED